ncbi:MAG TPA: glycosyltransferase family 4 protein [Prosthecobacter sp.]|nr:glycosyltransferase family 4 protein [Prosthecobacter sp.]
MRIALLHYTAAPVIGGVERVIADQARALRRLGHEVEVRTKGTGAPEGFDAVVVHNVFTMPFDLGWTRELRAAAAAAAARQGTRWFNWVHDVAAVNPYYAHLPWEDEAHAMLREAPRCVHVTVSEARREDYVRATGLAKEAIQVIPNGLELAEVLGLTERVSGLRLWEHDLVLFHPTRLIRRKNIELGIRVCAELRGRGCAAVYVVTGAPDPHQADGVRYHQELKSQAEELGVSKDVLFVGEAGALSDEDVRGLYAVADCLFFPSKGEGFGLPLLEAAMHRLPVFCSDLAVHREVMGDRGQVFHLESEAGTIAEQIFAWAAGAPEVARRRVVWRQHDMFKICQERLEPLLRIG